MRCKVLWIDDGAVFEANEFCGPVYNSRRYDLVIALTVSDAVRELWKTEFDAVIIDIRMDPGPSPEWTSLYQRAGTNRMNARLGLVLLQSLLQPGEAAVKLEAIPAWIKPDRFGILTVETERELEEHMRVFGIRKSAYRQKRAENPRVLLELIEAVLSQTAG